MLLNRYYQNFIFLPSSDEAEAGSGGDQPARNNLTDRNRKMGKFYSPVLFFYFNRRCLKKRTENITNSTFGSFL